ncbi:MAG: AI-2E family transporter [Pirellulales bacterium]
MSIQTSSPTTTWTPWQAVLATLAFVAVACCLGLLVWFHKIVCLLFVAILLATAVKPLIAAFVRRGVGQSTAVMSVYGVLTLAGIASLVAGLPALVQQLVGFAALVPERYGVVRGWLSGSSHMLVRRFGELLPKRLSAISLSDGTEPAAETTLDTVFNLSSWAASGIWMAVAILLLAIYWSLYEQRTLKGMTLLAAPRRRDGVLLLFARIESKLGDYIRGQGILCVSIFVLSFAAFYFIGIPSPLLLALIAGACEAVPMIGPILGAVPAILAAASVGSDKVLWVMGAAAVIQVIENNLLVPKVMDRTVGISPISTLVAMAVFGKLLGFAGAILAIPLAAIAQLLLEQFVFASETAGRRQASGRDRASRLRYEIDELLRDVRSRARHQEEPAEADESGQPMDEAIEKLAHDLANTLPAAKNGGPSATQTNEPDAGETTTNGSEVRS